MDPDLRRAFIGFLDEHCPDWGPRELQKLADLTQEGTLKPDSRLPPALTGEEPKLPPKGTTQRKILALLNGKGLALTTPEIAAKLGQEKKLQSVRVTLSRLKQRGLVGSRRPDKGRMKLFFLPESTLRLLTRKEG